MIKELYVYKRDSSFVGQYKYQYNFVGLIERYISCIWHEKFYDKGEFELVAFADKETIELLQTGRIILKEDLRTNKFQTFMEIKEIEIVSNTDEGDIIKVKGVSGNELLERRIIWDIAKFTNKNIVDVVYELVIEHAGGDMGIAQTYNKFYDFFETLPSGLTGSHRSLNIFVLKADRINTDIKITAQWTGKNILEVISQLCKEYGLGFKVETMGEFYIHTSSNTHMSLGSHNKFRLIVPTDRSKSVIFSDDFDNIYNATYAKNINNSINVVLLAAKGEGANRERFAFEKDSENYKELDAYFDKAGGFGPELFDRYEAYVDNRDQDSEELTRDDYIKSLRVNAAENFGSISEAFDTELFTDGVFKFNKDFFLGDYVTIRKFGLEIKAQIIENIESVDGNGYKNTPIFAY